MQTMRLVQTASAIVFAATAASAQVDPRAPAVLAAVGAELGEGFGADARYAIAFSDLNDDHHQEAIVHLAGQNFCASGGCTTYIMTETEAGWFEVGRMIGGRLPIYRLPEHHAGWFDLAMYVSAAGQQPGVRAVRYDRDRYRTNPARGQVIARLPQQATMIMPATSEMLPLGQ